MYFDAGGTSTFLQYVVRLANSRPPRLTATSTIAPSLSGLESVRYGKEPGSDQSCLLEHAFSFLSIKTVRRFEGSSLVFVEDDYARNLEPELKYWQQQDFYVESVKLAASSMGCEDCATFTKHVPRLRTF